MRKRIATLWNRPTSESSGAHATSPPTQPPQNTALNYLWYCLLLLTVVLGASMFVWILWPLSRRSQPTFTPKIPEPDTFFANRINFLGMETDDSIPTEQDIWRHERPLNVTAIRNMIQQILSELTDTDALARDIADQSGMQITLIPSSRSHPSTYYTMEHHAAFCEVPAMFPPKCVLPPRYEQRMQLDRYRFELKYVTFLPRKTPHPLIFYVGF